MCYALSVVANCDNFIVRLVVAFLFLLLYQREPISSVFPGLWRDARERHASSPLCRYTTIYTPHTVQLLMYHTTLSLNIRPSVYEYVFQMLLIFRDIRTGIYRIPCLVWVSKITCERWHCSGANSPYSSNGYTSQSPSAPHHLSILFSTFWKARRRSAMLFFSSAHTPYADTTFGVRAELRSPQVVPSYMGNSKCKQSYGYSKAHVPGLKK